MITGAGFSENSPRHASPIGSNGRPFTSTQPCPLPRRMQILTVLGRMISHRMTVMCACWYQSSTPFSYSLIFILYVQKICPRLLIYPHRTHWPIYIYMAVNKYCIVLAETALGSRTLTLLARSFINSCLTPLLSGTGGQGNLGTKILDFPLSV